MKKMTFYFDYISNNAYLAWTQLETLEKKFNLDIEIVPVLFAGLLKAHNNVGPAEIPAKRRWMSKNILRKAALLNVPIAAPKFHPFNPLLALRASSLLVEEGQRRKLIDQLFKAAWVDQLHISEAEVVEQAASAAGLNGADIVAQASTAEVSQRLKQQTQDAVAQGVFGIPTMMIDDELFFGYDDFVFIDSYLDGNEALSKEAFASWDQAVVMPSAMRKESPQHGDKQ